MSETTTKPECPSTVIPVADVDRAKTIDALVAACRELMAAMRDYEMDVDTDPPHKHREMMRRAVDAIQAASKDVI